MIKNLVFDLGQVIFSYKRKYMVERFVTEEGDSALLQKVVFDRLYWDKLDEGTISDEEACPQSTITIFSCLLTNSFHIWSPLFAVGP